MAEFPELGQHCEVADCNQLDFLPFQCNACSKTFCSDHRSYDAHNCKEGKAKDNQALFCPECNASLNVGYGGNGDEMLSRHLARECPVAAGRGPSKEKPKKKSCLVKGCRENMNIAGTTCKLCNQPVCLAHRFETDHDCPMLKGGAAPKKTAGPTQQRQPQQQRKTNYGGVSHSHSSKDGTMGEGPPLCGSCLVM